MDELMDENGRLKEYLRKIQDDNKNRENGSKDEKEAAAGARKGGGISSSKIEEVSEDSFDIEINERFK